MQIWALLGGPGEVSPESREGPVTQMPLPLVPSRAAWEVAAAAAAAEGGQPARPARGKQRHLLFPRSFPAAPSETQPAGQPAAAGPCPLPPRPAPDRVAGARVASGHSDARPLAARRQGVGVEQGLW